PERFEGMLPPVDAGILPAELLGDARVVVLIVIDGLGAHALADASRRGEVPGLMSAGWQSCLTSVFPSSTAAATTSLQYGVGPGAHGMAGYTLYLKEIDHVFNMITWRVAGRKDAGVDAPKPESFLRRTNLFKRLDRSEVDTVIVSNALFESSPLTRAQAADVRFRGYNTLADFTYRMVREVERPGRRFVFGYWDGFDVLGHSWGTDTAVAELELRLIDRALDEGLLQPLGDLGEDVAIVATADHGHMPTPREQRMNLSDIRGLSRSLSHRPTGEPRQLGLSFREGRRPEPEMLHDRWGDEMAALDMHEAIDAGLFGPAPHHRDLASRTGEMLLLSRGAGAFNFKGKVSGSLGGHGSLTPREMIVPLLVWRYFGR
ncbi:MAG: alkaline phosphatase family protein, partial [Thermomicrobiales bacterium]